MALPPALNPLEWLKVATTIQQLLALEKTLKAVIDKQADEIDQHRQSITRLETREDVITDEAKTAAAAAATVAMADLARRIGVLEERSTQSRRPSRERIESPRLGPISDPHADEP